MMDALSSFVASLDATPPLEWTYDVAALEALTGDDREQAEETLIARAESQHDARAIHTLVAAGCDHLADRIAPLTARNGPVGYAARRAMLGFRGEVQGVIDDRARGPAIERFAAVVALSGQRTDEAREALLDALSDDDPLVRSRAFDGLVEQHQLAGLRVNAGGVKELRAPLNRLDRLLSAELATLSRPAADELRFIFRALAAGADPASLDLVHRGGPVDVATMFRAWLTGATPHIPLADLAGASAHDKAYVEAMVAVQLQPSLARARAPMELVHLGAVWAVPALEEARDRAADGSEFRTQCDQALAAFSAASAPAAGA